MGYLHAELDVLPLSQQTPGRGAHLPARLVAAQLDRGAHEIAHLSETPG